MFDQFLTAWKTNSDNQLVTKDIDVNLHALYLDTN